MGGSHERSLESRVYRSFIFPHPPLTLQALEVDAYASVQDMIHAAIVQHGSQATLRQVRHSALAVAPCWLSQTLAPLPTYFDGGHCATLCTCRWFTPSA